MNKMLVIARREYKEVLRTQMFWVSSLLPIVIMVVAMVWGSRQITPKNARELAQLHSVSRAMGAFIYFFVMFISMMTPSQMLLTSLIEEKNSRMVEVLLSAVSPLELMAGKILGLIGVGLTTAAVYVAALAAVAGSTGLLQAPSAALLALFLAYYLLGFAIYASLFASVGAACNSLKEAQTVMFPLTLVLIAALHVLDEHRGASERPLRGGALDVPADGADGHDPADRRPAVAALVGHRRLAPAAGRRGAAHHLGRGEDFPDRRAALRQAAETRRDSPLGAQFVKFQSRLLPSFPRKRESRTLLPRACPLAQ